MHIGCHTATMICSSRMYVLQEEDTPYPANIDRVAVIVLKWLISFIIIFYVLCVLLFAAFILNYKFLRHFSAWSLIITRYYNNEKEIIEINRIKFIGQLLDSNSLLSIFIRCSSDSSTCNYYSSVCIYVYSEM